MNEKGEQSNSEMNDLKLVFYRHKISAFKNDD